MPPKKSATDYARKTSIAIISLILLSPPFGAVDADQQNNPAPSEALVGLRSPSFWHSTHVATLCQYEIPEDVSPLWNPFEGSSPFQDGSFLADDARRTVIAAGLRYLAEHIPYTLKNEEAPGTASTGALVTTALVSVPALAAFAQVWGQWWDLGVTGAGRDNIPALKKRLNDIMDTAVEAENLHPDQLSQQRRDGSDWTGVLHPAVHANLKRIALYACFGGSILEDSEGAGLQLAVWATTPASGLFKTTTERWKRSVVRHRAAYNRDKERAQKAEAGKHCCFSQLLRC